MRERGALPEEIVAVPLEDPVVEKQIGVVVPDRDPLPTITRALCTSEPPRVTRTV